MYVKLKILGGGNYTYCDDFGKAESENVILYVINTTSYVNLHSKKSYVDFYGGLSFSNFIQQLDNERVIILQDKLANLINKSIGENVTIETKNFFNFSAMKENLTIMGISKILPGIQPTWENSDRYAAIISWNTYFSITGEQYNQTTGNFWIKCDDLNNADSVLFSIRDLYQELGDPWNNVDFENTWENRSILEDSVQVKEIINLIQIVIVSVLYMALIISMFGLITSMIMSVNQRNNELGIFRAIGTSKIQIVQMIAGEILIISFTAILIGIISGIISGFLLSKVPFIAYVLFIFTINWTEIIYISLFLLILNLIGSIIPAIKAIRINIIENIQRRSI